MLCGGGRASTECLLQNVHAPILPFGSQGTNVCPSNAGVACLISRGRGLKRFNVKRASLKTSNKCVRESGLVGKGF